MKPDVRILLAVAVLAILNTTRIFYFNCVTHSLPYGIYERIDGIPHQGDFAASCLTDQVAEYGLQRRYLAPGNCPSGTVPVLKIIRGVPGDTYEQEQGFLKIHQAVYPIRGSDSSGRPLKIFYEHRGVLKQGQYFLISTFVDNSWDGRFWGPMPVQFLLRPLWIFENVKK